MIGKQLLYSMLANNAVLGGLRRRVPRDCTAVLMYHELAEDGADVEAWTVVRKSDFLRQVDYLRQHYDVISLDEALRRMNDGIASARPSVVLTFDDGDAGNHDILLPLVDALKLPVTVFVATGQVADQRLYWFDRLLNALQGDTARVLDLRGEGLGRYRVNHKDKGARNWLEIQRLLTDLKALAPERCDETVDRIVQRMERRAGEEVYQIRPLTASQVQALGASPWVTVGAHSHCHNLLTRIPLAAAEASAVRSRELLRQWAGQEIAHFAYPSGAYNAPLMQLMERLGFRSAATTEETFWQRDRSRYRIPRIGVGRYDTLETFKVNLVGGAGAARRLIGSLSASSA